MRSELITIGGITLYSYGLMLAIGMLSAIFVAEYRAGKLGLQANEILPLGVIGIIGGMLGAKVLYWITEIPEIIKDPSILTNFAEGYVVYGGIIGGIIGGAIYLRIKKLKFFPYLDLAVVSIALAQGFGRIGCLLAGCCYGRQTDAWYGMEFNHSDIAPAHVKLIPTQLFSSLLDFIHFGILVFIASRVKGKGKDGIIGGFYMLFYGMGRFAVEMLRDDPRGAVGSLSTSQFISIFMVIAGIIVIAVIEKKSAKQNTV